MSDKERIRMKCEVGSRDVGGREWGDGMGGRNGCRIMEGVPSSSCYAE